MRLLRIAVIAAACSTTPHTTLAQQTLRGISDDGAYWAIDMPAGWAPGDGLVLVQHGLSFAPVEEPAPAPWARRMLDDGYAVAASGYRDTGWAVAAAVDDNIDLFERFRAAHGEPGRVVTYGESMGGFIALKLAEDRRIASRIDGVVALCPAVDGVGIWDRVFDLRVA